MVGVQHFYDKGWHNLFWAGSQAACGKIAVNGLLDCLNYFVSFLLLPSKIPHWRKDRGNDICDGKERKKTT